MSLTTTPLCPRCHQPVAEEEEPFLCEGCLATHHHRCWLQGGGCSALASAPPPAPAAERPHQVRVRRRSWQTQEEAERRSQLVRRLGGQAQEQEAEEGQQETAFVRGNWHAQRGERRHCINCRAEFTVTKVSEYRCPRCLQRGWWVIGAIFLAVVLWKLIF